MLWVWGGVVGPWHDIPSGAEHAASEAKALQAKCTELQALIEAQRKEGEAKSKSAEKEKAELQSKLAKVQEQLEAKSKAADKAGAEHAASESEAKALQAKCKELQASIGSGQEARISFHRTLRIDLHFSTSAGFIEAAQSRNAAIGDSEAAGECLCRTGAADDWCM